MTCVKKVKVLRIKDTSFGIEWGVCVLEVSVLVC